MRLFTSLLLLLIYGTTIAQENPLFITHEWGTFTTLQRSNGERLNGLYRDEEVLPSFVHNISYTWYDEWYNDKGFWKGTELKNVSVKMETPVLYFYSDVVKQVHVDIEFVGGAISQWYPDRTNGEMNPKLEIINFAQDRTGWIEWDVTILAPGDQSLYTSESILETPQWVRPRATESNLIRGSDGNIEKFLFYRGIGNFEVPLKVEFNVEGDLVLTNLGDEGLSYVMVYEKQKNMPATTWWSGEIAGKYVKVVQRNNYAGNQEEIQQDLYEFENALVESGLYRDEAKAMLDTWKESYFEREGLKVFWIAPRSFTNHILPLEITPVPDELERVIVGRSEVLTPEFEEALRNGNNEEFYAQWHSDRFYHAYVQSRSGKQITAWTNITSDGFMLITNQDQSIPYVAIPNPFQDEISIYGHIDGNIEIVVSVYNNLGERIFSSTIQSHSGTFSDQFDMTNLVPGLYFIELYDGQNSWRRKIVKGG